MNWLFLTIGVAVAVGLFSLIFLRRWKRLQWLVFFLNAAFQTYVAVSLYSRPAFTETLILPFGALGRESLTLLLSKSALGYLFFGASVLLTVFIAIFSLSYNNKEHATSVAPLWTMLMGANAGIFFAGDWLTFVAAWELMSWTSYFIIAHGRERSGKAGLYYFILSLIGTSSLLAVVFWGVSATQSLRIADSLNFFISLWMDRVPAAGLPAVLFTLTFFAKSAVFPFYMWPSEAHAEAPDDFSAFLSGVMIKYGVFGMIALVLPLFGKQYVGPEFRGTPVFLYVLSWLGAFTAVWGTLHAIRENDMKRMMAHSTVSNIGFIIAALSLRSSFGIAAALFHTLNHMIFKSGIFMSMAAVKFRTGEREMHRLGGMAYRMPLTFFVFLLSIIAAAGIPPMSGFASKWMVFQSLFEKKYLILAIPAFFASTGAFMYLYRGLHGIFLGQLSPRFANIKEAPPLQSIAMTVIMLAVFAVGLFPGLVLNEVNKVLNEMDKFPITSDLSHISGVTTAINVTHIGLIFMGAFALTLLLFLIGKRRRKVDFLDNYTSGEAPEDWGMTPEQYHYALNFYEPFEKMVNPLLEKLSMDKLFRKIAFETKRSSNALRRWFNSPQFGLIVLTLILAVILFFWRVL